MTRIPVNPELLPIPDFRTRTDGHGVVTHEVPANSSRRINIPNACIGLSLRFMTPDEMLRRERARFVLGAHP